MLPMAALIMAAGQGTRFGGCKQLAMVNEKPLLQHSIDLADEICPGQVFVVSGAWHREMSSAIENKDIRKTRLVHHPKWADGLGSSIAKGVSFLDKQMDSILIVLADQIALRTVDVFRLRSQFTGDNIVCGFYAGRRGVPAIFGRHSFGKLKELHGDHGAKALLYDQHVPVVEYPLEHASIDIDTPEDLHLWTKNSEKVMT